MTSGFTASPAPMQWRRVRNVYFRSGSCTNIRYAVGGAKNVVIGKRSSISSVCAGSNRLPRASHTKSAAPMFQGAKTHVHAACAHPVSEIVQCRSAGVLSSQNRPVITWPMGYEACVWSTIFGKPVVPDVK
jgi:hypothetical protein